MCNTCTSKVAPVDLWGVVLNLFLLLLFLFRDTCEKGSGIFPDNNSAKVKFLVKIDKRQVKRKAFSREQAKSTRKL